MWSGTCPRQRAGTNLGITLGASLSLEDYILGLPVAQYLKMFVLSRFIVIHGGRVILMHGTVNPQICDS